MGKSGWILVGGLLLGGMVPMAAQADPCPSRPPLPPAAETRPYSDPQRGFGFAIPANYRAMGTSLGTVQFYDPATFERVQCLVQRRPLALRPTGTTLAVRPLKDASSDPQAALEQTHPWLTFYTPVYEPVSLGGVAGVRYRYRHTLYRLEMAGVAWLAGDGRSLITLEGPAASPVIPLAIATLQSGDGAAASRPEAVTTPPAPAEPEP